MNTKTTSKNISPIPTGQLVAELSACAYADLISFARGKLRRLSQCPVLQSRMALIDPEDLVHDAFLKVLVGQDRPNAGRHISGRYRHDVSDFLVAIKGIINSDLSHLTRDAIGQPELVTYSDEEPENIDPTRREQFDDLLARRDLQAVLFTELFKQVPIDSAMHTVIEDWEERFLDDNRVGSKGDNPNVVHRVRVLAREIISQVEPDLLPSAA